MNNLHELLESIQAIFTARLMQKWQ